MSQASQVPSTDPPVHQKDLAVEKEAREKAKKTEKSENRESFLDELYEVQFTAGSNVRYHQIYAGWWERWETYAHVLTGVSAFLSCIFAFSSWPPFVSQGFTVLTAFLAVLLNVLPFGRWSQTHSDLFRRWSDLLEDSETFQVNLLASITARDWDQLKIMKAKIYRIGACEPPVDIKTFLKCEAQERLHRGEEEPK